jgi:hypothetical protein
MGPKGEPDTKTNWSTGCRPQDELQHQPQFPYQPTDQRYAIWDSDIRLITNT